MGGLRRDFCEFGFLAFFELGFVGFELGYRRLELGEGGLRGG